MDTCGTELISTTIYLYPLKFISQVNLIIVYGAAPPTKNNSILIKIKTTVLDYGKVINGGFYIIF